MRRSGAEGFFVGGADWFVGAAAAGEAAFGREFAGADISGDFLDYFLGFVELLVCARGGLDLIVLEVMECEADGIELQDFFGGDGVDAELEVAAGVGFLAGFAGLVVDDLDVFLTERIDLVDAAVDDDVVFERELEGFFLLEDFGRIGEEIRVEDAKLLDAVFFVFGFLVFVLVAGRGPLGFEHAGYFFERKFYTLTVLVDEAANRGVHDGAEAERGGRAFFERPEATEEEELRALAIGIDGGGAEFERLGRGRMVGLGPFGDLRMDARAFGERREEFFGVFGSVVGAACVAQFYFWRDLKDVALANGRIHQDVFDERGDFAFFLGERGDGEFSLGAGERDVEEAALFLDMEVAGGQVFLHQLHREFEERRAFARGEARVIDAQEEHVRELETFGAVDGHELNGVAGSFIVEADGAEAGLFEIVEVFEEFGEGFSVALGLPGFEEFDELGDVTARARADEMRDFEPVDQRAEDVDGGAAL